MTAQKLGRPAPAREEQHAQSGPEQHQSAGLGYENATPDTVWRHFPDATGTLHITADAVTCALNLRSHHPVLIDAGFADLEVPIPWWNDRPLRFRFPPR